jgi:hypothetical protein
MAEITFRLQSEEINKEVLQQLVGVAEAGSGVEVMMLA